MRVFSLPKAFYHIARHPPLNLSPEGRERLRLPSCWQALRGKGLSSAEASQALAWKTPAEYIIKHHPEVAHLSHM